MLYKQNKIYLYVYMEGLCDYRILSLFIKEKLLII